VHPELFQIHQQRVVDRTQYQVRLDITSDGHIITFRSGTVTISEVVCAATQLLPKRRQLHSQSFLARNLEVVEVRHNVAYRTRFEIERVRPDFFWTIHEQLGKTSEPNGLCQLFNSSGRMPWGALSYILVEERQRSILIQSLHTFPDDYQLLKACTSFQVM
jgi:hypothetical protein